MTAPARTVAGRSGPPVDPDPDRRIRRVAAVLLVVVAVAVVLIVSWPTPPDRSSQQALANFLTRAHRVGLPHWISFDLVEGLSNAVMFAPLGFLGALALRRRPWVVVPAAAMVSGLIELSQALFLPGRYGSWLDVEHNTLGALAGLLIALPWLRRRSARRRRASLGRRGAGDRQR